MLYPCILCVALLVYLCVLCVACLTVFVNCLVKQFAMCLGVVAILLLNVMDVFGVGGVLCWIDRVWSSKECTCCACDPNVHITVPSICFVCVFCMSEVISSFKSWITGVCCPYVVSSTAINFITSNMFGVYNLYYQFRFDLLNLQFQLSVITLIVYVAEIHNPVL